MHKVKRRLCKALQVTDLPLIVCIEDIDLPGRNRWEYELIRISSLELGVALVSSCSSVLRRKATGPAIALVAAASMRRVAPCGTPCRLDASRPRGD